jgi:hypothetical protein
MKSKQQKPSISKRLQNALKVLHEEFGKGDIRICHQLEVKRELVDLLPSQVPNFVEFPDKAVKSIKAMTEFGELPEDHFKAYWMQDAKKNMFVAIMQKPKWIKE